MEGGREGLPHTLVTLHGFQFLDRTPISGVRTCQDEQKCIPVIKFSLYILSRPWFFCGCWAHCRRCGSCCADIDHRCSSNSSGSSREREENTKRVSALSTQLHEKFDCHVIFSF